MADIKSGVLLKLKDDFSKGIHKAAGASGDFAKKTIGALDKINSALSGTAAKLGAFGVTLSVGAAAKEIIELDDRLTRIGLTADASAEQVGRLKQKIFEAALELKTGTDGIVDAVAVAMTKTGDLKYAGANIKNIAIAIQATGESGDAIGSVFSEFQKFGYKTEEVSALMDDMVKQGDMGAFTFGEFAKAGSAVISAYAQIGTSPEDLKQANAAMQIIMMGTKNADIAVTALESTMAELSDPAKQEKLAAYGVSVRDEAGAFRDLNDVMKDVLDVAKEKGNTDFLGEIFGESSMRLIRSYSNFYADMYPKLTNLGDTQGAMQAKAARMSGTLASNLKNLQTAFVRFADSNLTAPLAKLTDMLNKLAEDPKRVEAVFNAIKRGLIIIGGIKIGAGVMSFLQTIRNAKGGTAQLNLAGSAAQAMPVFVTNWGGAGSAAPFTGTQSVGADGAPAAKQGAFGAAKTAVQTLSKAKLVGAGIFGGVLGAVEGAIDLSDDLDKINNDETLTGIERSKKKGGAWGNAAGKTIGGVAGGVAGMAAGAALGAAVGSVIPGIGNIVGLIVGGAIGAAGIKLGGAAGRAIGEGIGEVAASGGENKIPVSQYGIMPYGTIPVSNLPPAITGYAPYAPGQQAMRFDGKVGLQTDLYIHRDGSFTATQKTRNDSNFPYETGSAFYARGTN
jgi:hypothetical protein